MKWILPLIFMILFPSQEDETFIHYKGGINEIQCNSVPKGKVEIRELTYYNKKYGYSIWLNYDQTKVKYFTINGAYNNTSSRFNTWNSRNQSIISTSGGYISQDYNKPIGLSIDKGNVVNQNFEQNMDAIVLEHKGKIIIYNKNGRFWFRPLSRYINLNNSRDRVNFIKWAKKEKASAFQTHLLAYKNELNISPKGSKRRALRKFLVLLSDKAGTEKIGIFYLRSPENLYTATKKIFSYLKTEQYNIHSFINLDTGVNDVLELNQAYRNCNNKIIKGRTHINHSVDLLAFYN